MRRESITRARRLGSSIRRTSKALPEGNQHAAGAEVMHGQVEMCSAAVVHAYPSACSWFISFYAIQITCSQLQGHTSIWCALPFALVESLSTQAPRACSVPWGHGHSSVLVTTIKQILFGILRSTKSDTWSILKPSLAKSNSESQRPVRFPALTVFCLPRGCVGSKASPKRSVPSSSDTASPTSNFYRL